jgi:hypothetical protein
VNTPLHIKLFTWLGIAAISVQLGAVPLDFLLFRLNQDQIARTLCEHKMPHCNGNCYLMKQLAKSTNANNEKRTERFTLQLSGQYLRSEVNNLACFASSNCNVPICIARNTLPGFHTTVLQPPRFA